MQSANTPTFLQKQQRQAQAGICARRHTQTQTHTHSVLKKKTTTKKPDRLLYS